MKGDPQTERVHRRDVDYARLRSDLASGDVHSLGVGALDLDVDIARHHGWSDDQIIRAFFALGAISRETNRQIAVRKGYRYVCPNCECWTNTPPLPCHLCKADEERARTEPST